MARARRGFVGTAIALAAKAVEVSNPPAGKFLDVRGIKLHYVEQGLDASTCSNDRAFARQRHHASGFSAFGCRRAYRRRYRIVVIDARALATLPVLATHLDARSPGRPLRRSSRTACHRPRSCRRPFLGGPRRPSDGERHRSKVVAIVLFRASITPASALTSCSQPPAPYPSSATS